MSNSQAIINFMYFANNFSHDQLQEVFKSTDCPSHLESKFKSMLEPNKSGTDVFLRWFMLLDRDNKNAVSNWITLNYKG